MFIHETAVYNLLKENGVKTPVCGFISVDGKMSEMPFQDGEKVVVKGLADELWHKSDEGALHFVEFSKDKMMEVHQTILKIDNF